MEAVIVYTEKKIQFVIGFVPIFSVTSVSLRTGVNVYLKISADYLIM